MATASENVCPICMDVPSDPRLLPCVHSFCFRCLNHHCQDKLPGDEAACPVCRMTFLIPKNGIAGFTQQTLGHQAPKCEACSTGVAPVPATVYCVDCRQKLCERCGIPHKKMRGGPHDVRPLGTLPSDSAAGKNCSEHKEQLRMYCVSCKTAVCSMCCLEKHKTHKYDRIEKVTEQLSKSIDDELKPITQRIDSLRAAAAKVETETNRLLSNIKVLDEEAKTRSRKVRELIDGQEANVLNNIQALKLSADKAAKSRLHEIQTAQAELDSFKTSSLELRSKGSPSDIAQAVDDVRFRAKQLLRSSTIPAEYRAPSYKLTPVNFDTFRRDGGSFVGQVVKTDDNQGGADSQIHAEAEVHVKTVPVSEPVKLQLKHAAKQDRQDGVKKQPGRLSSVRASARLVKSITFASGVTVLGVTLLSGELFILLRQDIDQVAVYSVSHYQPLRRLSVPGLKKDDHNDMAACVKYICLYISDFPNNCIHRYDLRRASWSKWGEGALSKPCGLSVNSSSNLIVICQGHPNKVLELSGAENGKCLRDIKLQSDIDYPFHSKLMSSGEFVVCNDGYLQRVTAVDGAGRIVRSYGGPRGLKTGQLDRPCHLAVDEDSQAVFVADRENNRLVMLSSTLEFERSVSERLPWPARLHFDQSTRRMYVGQWGASGSVTVLQL